MKDEPAPDIPAIAGLLADPARAKILWTLIDGTTRPAGELAYAANVSAQSASAHLGKLVEGGLLVSEAQGRHRYFRIASADVAEAIEGIASLSTALAASGKPRKPRDPLPSPDVPRQFLQSRTCYDHLAGEAAVQLLENMLKARWLLPQGRDYTLTPLGEKKLAANGIDLVAARASRRSFARGCVDLTQRRPHLSGALGAALLDLAVARGWVLRARRTRVVTITPKGHAAFGKLCA
jgi:DNA-binding transcriptional ArsR family regulator